MKKTSNRFLGGFVLVYEIFLYSIALKIFLGLMWMVGGLYVWFSGLPWVTQVIASVVAGFSLRLWRKNHLKNKSISNQ